MFVLFSFLMYFIDKTSAYQAKAHLLYSWPLRNRDSLTIFHCPTSQILHCSSTHFSRGIHSLYATSACCCSNVVAEPFWALNLFVAGVFLRGSVQNETAVPPHKIECGVSFHKTIHTYHELCVYERPSWFAPAAPLWSVSLRPWYMSPLQCYLVDWKQSCTNCSPCRQLTQMLFLWLPTLSLAYRSFGN